jgi:hypothetical protein
MVGKMPCVTPAPCLCLLPCVVFFRFAESDSKFVISAGVAYGKFNHHILHDQPANQPSYTSHTMSSLLHIACRIQAAVKAYNSVKGNTDRAKWKAGFENEQVRPIF